MDASNKEESEHYSSGKISSIEEVGTSSMEVSGNTSRKTDVLDQIVKITPTIIILS